MSHPSTDAATDPPAAEPQLPVFPTTAPPVFRDAAAAVALVDPVLARLAELVELPADALEAPTPCPAYTVETLRGHVLAWLEFFAAALTDPTGARPRPDPDSWQLGEVEPGDAVRRAHADIRRAALDGVADGLVVMSQARMAGDGVLAMALGEYLVHGWDLATATGQRYEETADITAAAEPALAFLRTIVAPEHRGPESGFFGEEVPAPPGASPLVRLLCFAGRTPDWSPPTR